MINNNKILMIVSHFYPNGSIVEAKNNYLTVLELEKNGFEVDVCTFIADKKYPENVKYLLEKKSKIFSIKNRYYNFFRKKVKMPLLPIGFKYVQSFLKVINTIDVNQYAYIYTVFGDGSEHIVGEKLKKQYPHLKHIAEFRDPWIHNEITKKYFYDHSFGFYADYNWNRLKNIQKRLISNIDLLLVESSYHGVLIKKDFNYNKKILICNGYSKVFMEKILDLGVDFKYRPIIGFVGSTYYGYDDVAEVFIEVLEELEKEGVKFTFVSVGNNYFSKLAASSALTNFYSFQKVSYIKALSFINKVDIGLAMTMNSYANHINSKIFEYMQYKKFTLAIAPKNGAMDELLSKTETGLVLSYGKEEMKNELRSFLKSFTKITLSDEQIKMFDRKEIFKSIVAEIKQL